MGGTMAPASEVRGAAPVISIRDVSKIFGQGEHAVTALDRVRIDIGQNEFFTLLGPSGCGKTTLLRLIAGFDYPTSGEIRLFGEDIARQPPYKRPINTVFQNYALFPHMTVGQNVGFGLEMLGRPKAEIEARIDEMLRLVRMEALKHRRTSEISGGQQQRVALARALAPQPKVLLLDEPLSALDYKLRKEMQIELKRLQHETGITFIFVTHDQEEALTMSDRIAVMSGGKVLQIGTAHEIYESPTERFVANFIGETNFLEGEVTGTDGNNFQVRLDSGAVLPASPPEGFAPKGRVTLVIRPEHARLVPPDSGASFSGTVSNVVYFGTDTHYYVAQDGGGGEDFMVRQQNSRSMTSFEIGARVGVQVDAEAARVLKD